MNKQRIFFFFFGLLVFFFELYLIIIDYKSILTIPLVVLSAVLILIAIFDPKKKWKEDNNEN